MSNNEAIIRNVQKWQMNPAVHPLTCGNKSSHDPLVPIERNGKVILACADCLYEQEYIPEFLTQGDECEDIDAHWTDGVDTDIAHEGNDPDAF